MTRFRLAREEGPDLEFTGKLLAEEDSRDRQQKHDRWVIVRIYRTDDGRYVTERIRRFALGEPDIITVRVVDNPADVVPSLQLEGQERPTKVAVRAVLAAAAVDPALQEHAVERI